MKRLTLHRIASLLHCLIAFVAQLCSLEPLDLTAMTTDCWQVAVWRVGGYNRL
jgi:hypothetical protein